MIPMVRLRATFDCVKWLSDEDGDYDQWGGWCDPQNPWGTTDDDWPRDVGAPAMLPGEAIEHSLPIFEAAEFIRDFPGACWELNSECDPSENYANGVQTTVMLHVDGDGGPAALEIAQRLSDEKDARLRQMLSERSAR